MAITIKEVAEKEVAVKDVVYIETKSVESVQEFTILQLDRQVERIEIEIGNLNDRKDVLIAKKTAALAVK